MRDAVATSSVRTFANQPFLKLISFTKAPSESRVGGSQNIKLTCTDHRKLEHAVNTGDYSTDILTKSQLRSKSCMSLKSSKNPFLMRVTCCTTFSHVGLSTLLVNIIHSVINVSPRTPFDLSCALL